MQKQASMSILVGLAVHLIVFASWISAIALDVEWWKPATPNKKTEPESEVTLFLRPVIEEPIIEQPIKPKPKPLVFNEPRLDAPPKPKTLPPKPPEPRPDIKPKPPKPSIAVKLEAPAKEESKPLPAPKHRFARTSADQAGKPDQPTDILGDRDTRGASEAVPTPGAKPNTPSQDGIKPLHPGQVETVNSDHQDGSLGADKRGEETETPQEATASTDSTTIDEAPKLEVPDPEDGSSAKPKNEYLKEGTILPNSQKGEGKAAIQDKPKADEAPKEKPNKGAQKDGKGDATDQDLKKDGFKGFSRQNKVTGSISRRGKSALNVKNSPLGRYQALISKSVELEWRRKCDEQRDHIVPGVVSVRFYVDSKGKISGVKFQEVIGASYIMTGFTQRAIRQAKLPKMSSSVIKELKGEPLELIYNFYF